MDGNNSLYDAPIGTGSAPIERFFHPVLLSRELATRPRQVVVHDQPFVLFRQQDGTPAALVDRCPHRFAPLSSGFVRPDGRLQCPYHGWRFGPDGCGESPSQPTLAKCDAAAMQVIERHGFIWIAGRDVPAESFPVYEWDDFGFAGCCSQLFEAPLHVVLDNFSEDEHTPFVHHALGWDESECGGIEFSAENFDDRSEVKYSAPQRSFMLLRFVFIQRGDHFHNHWTTRYDPVRLMYHLFWSDPASGKERGFQVRAILHLVPINARQTKMQVMLWTRFRDMKNKKSPLIPLLNWFAARVIQREVKDDAEFIPTVAETPADMTGMRLGKYDKPLVNNAKLLPKIYWGAS